MEISNYRLVKANWKPLNFFLIAILNTIFVKLKLLIFYTLHFLELSIFFRRNLSVSVAVSVVSMLVVVFLIPFGKVKSHIPCMDPGAGSETFLELLKLFELSCFKASHQQKCM